MAFRFLIMLAVFAAPVLSYSSGAPPSACADLTPKHKVDPQRSASPYDILLSKNKIRSGDTVELTLVGKSGRDTITGFICQARVGKTPIGQFHVPSATSALAQATDCNGNQVSYSKNTIK